MTVFIAHAEADRPAAEALERFLERRGLFVELEDGARGFRHVQNADTVVALWSKDVVFSPYRLLFEKRTLEAWADEQLVMVKLDHGFAPVGLRDLAAIDASFEAQRDIAWAAVAKVAQDARLRPARQAAPAEGFSRERAESDAGPPPAASAPAPQAKPPSRKRGGAAWFIALVIAVAAGLVVFTPPSLRVLVLNLLGLAGGGVTSTAPQGPVSSAPPEAFAYQVFLPIGGAVVALLAIGHVFLVLRGSGAKRKKTAGASPAGPSAPGEPLFVSYSHADNTAVLPVVEAVQAQGRSVWIDKQGISGGEGWAGEIVRAIKGAKGVIVMCSKHAFESDHVKREVYLADRYKKTMVPVFIEAATPPEDFEYFFAGVQWLELHKTPLADRAAALAKALKAV